MRQPTRRFRIALIIAGGYVAALLIAGMVVSVHQAHTVNDASGADGMFAFGDLLLFVVVFGLIGVVHTIASIYLLRADKPDDGPR